MWAFIFGFLSAISIIFLWRIRTSQRFDLSEELLNITPAEQHWGNLGYWDNTQDYPTACQQLAKHVADEAGLNSTSEIMDVGFGSGDQLLLWHQTYQVQSISAVNTSQAQVGLAQKKLRQAKVKAFIHHYDHRALNIQADRQFTHVLSVDAAYFFNHRAVWFQQAQRVLKPEGKLVLTDLILPQEPTDLIQAFVMKTLLRLCGIPKENIITLKQYEQQLAAADFRDITMQDISHSVLDGFAEWLPQYQVRFEGLQHFPIWHKYKGTAQILGWLRKHDLMRCYLISARR